MKMRAALVLFLLLLLLLRFFFYLVNLIMVATLIVRHIYMMSIFVVKGKRMNKINERKKRKKKNMCELLSRCDSVAYISFRAM